jgi:uridine phosphorylase
MIKRNEFPILEFDDNKNALINPSNVTKNESSLNCNKLIITFFGEILQRLIDNNVVQFYRLIRGENPYNIYKFVDSDVLIIHGQIGCPACAGNLDLLNYLGVNKVMFCGGGGVLDKTIEVGRILVVEGAIRDEGFSYHYVEPSKYIYSDKKVVEKITDYLDKNHIAYLKGLTWTTDAMFRETIERITLRKEEGARIVEMEQAGCLAVAQFRGFDYGALIYGGDDVSKDEWDKRSWRSREGIRYDLIMLCKKIVEII